MFRQVRDHFLLPVLSDLQLKSTHSMISVDGETPGRPIEISWDSHLSQTLSWSESFGVVGTAMKFSRFWPHGDRKTIGMIQLGGVVLTEREFKGTPPGWYIKAKQSKTTKKYTVLTHQGWYLSAWGLWLLGEQGSEVIVWHSVPETKFGTALNKAFENGAP